MRALTSNCQLECLKCTQFGVGACVYISFHQIGFVTVMMHIWDSTCSVDGEGIGEIKSGGVVQVGFLLAFRETRDEQKRSWSNLWHTSCVHDGEVCGCDDSDFLNFIFR